MTITREQVADLQPGDVVELSWPHTDADDVVVTVRGPARGNSEALFLGGYCLRDVYGNPVYGNRRTLVVISRVPRPLYVNHPRAEPIDGDVVRSAEDLVRATWTYRREDEGDKYPWVGPRDWSNSDRDNFWYHRDDLPERLLLLVDGETGQVVQ